MARRFFLSLAILFVAAVSLGGLCSEGINYACKEACALLRLSDARCISYCKDNLIRVLGEKLKAKFGRDGGADKPNFCPIR